MKLKWDIEPLLTGDNGDTFEKGITMKPTTAIRLVYLISTLIGLAGLSVGIYLMATLEALWPFSFFAIGTLLLYGGVGGLIASKRWK